MNHSGFAMRKIISMSIALPLSVAVIAVAIGHLVPVASSDAAPVPNTAPHSASVSNSAPITLEGDLQNRVANPVVTISGGSLQPAYYNPQPALGIDYIQGATTSAPSSRS
jgi:hypothetical protein